MGVLRKRDAESRAGSVRHGRGAVLVTAEHGADNTIVGSIFNEYSLGSRLQYQVRSKSGRTFLVEVPRAGAFRGSGEVTIGWDAANAIVVGG